MKKILNFHWGLKTFWIDTLYFCFGSVLYALGIYTFALNANFAPGGITGVAIIFNHYTGWPVGIVSLVLNIPLILMSLRIIGTSFVVKTGWALVISTIFLDVVFPLLPTYTGNPLLAALFCGVCGGAGSAFIYLRGSSTGGSDFVTLSIKKKKPHLSVGRIGLVVDGVVVLAGGFVFGNVDAVLYGIVAGFAGTLMTDNILYGAGGSKLAIIITDYGREIADAISSEIERGSTLVESTGTFTGQKRDMLFCACGKSEGYKVRMAAMAVDPKSLVMLTDASEVVGEGFELPPIPGNETPEVTQTVSGANAIKDHEGEEPAEKLRRH